MIDRCQFRLLRHEPASGPWNMAVDEMLLEFAAERAAPCLRIYRWSEPTLSFGYFQTYADRQEHAASRHCAAVRRLTGGGAILHDHEITYSIVLPGGHPLALRRDELYQALHSCLIDTLADFGQAARLCGAVHGPAKGTVPFLLTQKSEQPPREPFLCFQRRSPGDVLLGEHKICGSAQRRRNEAVLQHGSLLWRVSAAAPELPGIADLAHGAIPSMSDLAEAWLDCLGRRMGWAWNADELTSSELRRAEPLMETRYRQDGWTKYRDRPHSCGTS